MNGRVSRTCRSLLPALALLASASPGSAGSRALLIGINRYPSPEIPDLRGARNDVETMEEVLTTRFGFPAEGIRKVLDEQATRRGILTALREVVSGAGPGDAVYIHYSGHGSQVEDLDGDEPDGRDETLIPHDGRTDGVPDITDDELRDILSDLRTERCVIVLDSCHSGTATRSAAFAARSVPADDRLHLYAAMGRRAVVDLESAERYLLLTGAAAHQSALDGPLPPGQTDRRPHGLFTYALGEVLRSGPTDASATAVHAAVQQTLARLDEELGGGGLPDPQFEGAASRLASPLIAVAGAVASPPIDAAAIGPGLVSLRRGRARGATIGSLWAVAGGGSSAIVRVDRLQGHDAIATVVEGTPPAHGRAALVLGPSADGRVPLRIRGMKDLLRQQLVAALLERIPVQVVEDDALARVVLEVEGHAARVLGAASGETLATFGSEDVEGIAAGIAEEVDRSSSAAALLSLTNPAGSIGLDARLTTPREILYVYREDEPVTAENHLQLEVESDVDGYLTVVDVDPEGGVNLLFPNEHQSPRFLPGGRVRAGTTVRIPDTLDTEPEAGFRWPLQPPVGRETIQVFLMTDREAAEALRDAVRAGTMGTRGEGKPTRDAVRDLRLDLARIATRGVGIVPSRTEEIDLDAPDPDNDEGLLELGSDWTSASVVFEIRE